MRLLLMPLLRTRSGGADDVRFKGSDWRGIRVRRDISSARPRTRRCATGKDLVLFLWSLSLTVCRLRDVNAYSKANSSIEPLNVFDEHTAVVGVCSASRARR